MSLASGILSLTCVLNLFVFSSDAPTRDESPSTNFAATDLDPRWLDATRHPQTGLLTRHIRPDEAVGYFAILNHARQLPLAQLKAAARKFQAERLAVIKRDPNFRYYFRKPNAEFPTFVDLYRNSEAYHGRLVTFRGHLRRLVSFPAGENPQGFRQLHEAWLYVDDAQQNPVVVVCSELPPGIPTGSDILVDFVSATGYFFKRYGYEDRTGQSRFAPLILAQRLEWSPPPSRSVFVSAGLLFGLTIGGAAVVAMMWWVLSRHGRRRVVRMSFEDSPSFAETSIVAPNPDRTQPELPHDASIAAARPSPLSSKMESERNSESLPP